MRKRGVRVALSVGFAAALLAACSSSSSNKAAPPAKVQADAAAAAVTTTTAPVAIGLRRNADEQGELVPDKPLTHPQRQALADELQVARAAALKYPTVKDALAAGYIQAGRFTPGAGAHFISYSGAAKNFLGKGTEVNAADPLALIYEGISPTSRVTGLMYGSFATNPPDGFTGPNDHWHRHTNLCITFNKGQIGIPFPPDVGVKKSECDKYPHSMFMRRSLWMVHAWVVPGWESPEGVFSHANIDLHCADGTDKVDTTGFCTGAA